MSSNAKFPRTLLTFQLLPGVINDSLKMTQTKITQTFNFHIRGMFFKCIVF